MTYVLVLALAGLMGCEKAFDQALDRAADSRETLEGMLGDADKVRALISPCYAGIPTHRSDIYFWTTFESLTDNAFDSQAQSMGNWRNGILSPSQSALFATQKLGNSTINWGTGGSYWGRYWAAIRACNTVIVNMPNVTASLKDLPQVDRDQLVDEARILRAHFHIQLIGMYGPIPFMTEVHDVNFDGWTTMERPSYDEIANTIADELQSVIDNSNVPLKRNPDVTTDKYRVPLAYAYGLKSRVLLYNASPLNNPSGDAAKYKAAADAAEQFLALGAYSLEPFENTKKALYNSSMDVNSEAIELIWRGNGGLTNLSSVHGMDLTATVPKRTVKKNAKAGETPTQEMVDCYELKTGELIIENYDPSHASPVFTAEAIAAGYNDIDSPYVNRDARFYRDILFNGNDFGESYDMGPIQIFTYLGCPGTGTNGNASSGLKFNTFTGYYYGKDRDPIYYGSGNGATRSKQYSVRMRYAEIYLNYAEALCGAGKLSDACDALDMTRLRAGQLSIKLVPGFSLEKAWLMKRIYNERRVELVLENHRFFDVRRWNIISNQNNNTISGMEVTKVEGTTDQYKHTRYQMPFTWACHNEKYKVMPIPLSDQKLMPNMLQPEAWQ